MEKVIEVSNLRKTYRDKVAIDNLSLDVYKGEVFGLLGPNGAGKSSTIECILGVKSMDSGKVSLLEMEIKKDRKEIFKKVGVQFQQSSYQPKIKVWELCEVNASLYDSPKDYKKLLIDFGLDKLEKSYVSQLSGGEFQKLSVVLALIPNPKIVFLDELTTGLDSKVRRVVWKHLIKMKEEGLTIFLTSHYMDEVEYLCDRVCILKEGKVVTLDTVENVIYNSPYDKLEDSYLWYTGEEVVNDESI